MIPYLTPSGGAWIADAQYQWVSWGRPSVAPDKFEPGQAGRRGTSTEERLSDVNFIEFAHAKYVFCLAPKFSSAICSARASL
jgi:hypothetical protein